MFIEFKKIQIDESKFVDTKDTSNQRQRGNSGCISPEFLTILVKTSAKILVNGYIYSAFMSNGYPIVLREPYNEPK